MAVLARRDKNAAQQRSKSWVLSYAGDYPIVIFERVLNIYGECHLNSTRPALSTSIFRNALEYWSDQAGRTRGGSQFGRDNEGGWGGLAEGAT